MSDTKAMSATPLSDLIAAHMASGTPETWARFLDIFRKSEVGIHAIGVPEGATGEFVTTANQPLSVGLTGHAGGRPLALAFADPPAFALRFGQPFNAGLTGEAVLATVLANPDCAGVLVNSALDEMSVVIDRATAESLVRPAGERAAAELWRGFR